MTPSLLVDGRPLRVGKRIGRGGEGDVYQLDDHSGQALKVYKSPDRQREAKIADMVAGNLAANSKLIAFPTGVARDRAGRFHGFTMRLVTGHQPLHELYAPGSRKISFPAADYRFLVRAAANIARAVGQVHQAGAVIGDINHSGILISEQAISALIDADSFQFGSHLCRVGVPEYTPPELQSRSLANVVRTPQHDAFGLAVVIFQLLFMGRHPFVGRYARGEMPIEKAISEFRFAYSARADVGMTPPPGTGRLSDFPPEIGAAFEAAFSRDPSGRPTPVQWSTLLHTLEPALRKCASNTLHHFPPASKSCAWCAMENSVGMILFVPVVSLGTATPIVDPGAGGFNLALVWASIERVKVPDLDGLMPPTPGLDLSPSDAANAHKQSHANQRILGFVAIAVAVALLYGLTDLWIVYIPLAWFGVVKAFSTEQSQGPFASTYVRSEQAFQAALLDWRRRCGVTEIEGLRASLSEAKQRYADLPTLERRKLDEYESKRRDIQLRRFLDTFPVRRARIRGIGPARVATLASYGIDTAADVTRGAILRVPGFGDATAQPLLAWRARVESRFVFSPQPTFADQQATEQIRRTFAAEATQLRQTLLRGASDLQRGVQAVQARIKNSDPVVNRAYADREQARIDLEALGQQLPLVPSISARVVVAPPTSKMSRSIASSTPSGAQPSVSCPKCGGQMVRRVARRGRNIGGAFWGCARYPSCRGTRRI